MNFLTEDQLRHFDEEGWLLAPEVFDPADLEDLRAEIEKQLDGHIEDAAEAGEVAEKAEGFDFDHRLAEIARHDPEGARAVMRRLKGKGGGKHAGPAMFNTIRHPKLISYIEDFIGPEIIGSSVYRIRPKTPYIKDGEVPWHQDSGYLLEHCDRTLIITCWIPLVNATVDRGCLYVLPRAHKQGIYKHRTRGNANFLVIKDEDLPDGGEPTPVPVPLGGVLFMTNLTPHSSGPNDSDIVRWSIDLRYQDAAVPNNVGLTPQDLRQQMEKGAGEEVEIACYPPEADFVIQSPSNPEKEIRTVEEFRALRSLYEGAPLQMALRWTETATE